MQTFDSKSTSDDRNHSIQRPHKQQLTLEEADKQPRPRTKSFRVTEIAREKSLSSAPSR